MNFIWRSILLSSVFIAACQVPGSPTGLGENIRYPVEDPNGYLPSDSDYGTLSDVQYAGLLWNSLAAQGIVDVNAMPGKPFFGGAKPHGMILEIFDQMVSVENHQGFVVVKKNYDGEGVSVESVEKDRARYLSSITVMYQREQHYDDLNQNWFWAKYQADGSLFNALINGRKVLLAGRLIKGDTWESSGGCIYCHHSAGGGDYVFYPEIVVPGKEVDVQEE